ncbi:MAG TPA: hypothetical protein VMD31_14545, partial [Opitutaceae bacterium]|nr:hypothetical protein [Opitutaceae bacterium]
VTTELRRGEDRRQRQQHGRHGGRTAAGAEYRRGRQADRGEEFEVDDARPPRVGPSRTSAG